MIKLADRPADGFYPHLAATDLSAALRLFGEHHPRSVSIDELSDRLGDDEDDGLTSGTWDHLEDLGLIRHWLDRGLQTALLTDIGHEVACVEMDRATLQPWRPSPLPPANRRRASCSATDDPVA